MRKGYRSESNSIPQAKYKKLLERNLQGSNLHTIFSQSEFLFSKDPTLADLHKDIDVIGERDKQSQLFNTASCVTTILAKTEKWFHVKKDYDYTFYYLMYAVRQLSVIETIMHGETPKRKVIYQALKAQSEVFLMPSLPTFSIYPKMRRRLARC